ncbi:MAG TPA: COX15/CtaA family protein [Streptosporangiaceae bacterium]|nr:COX15/CtaA family protein [Streptosporangiaceae bacterium]
MPADLSPPPGDPAGPAPAAGPPPAPRGAGGARSAARRWVAAVWDPTPVSMRRIALAGVISSAVIIVTGAAVRLSKSGLGCPDWPQCTRSSLVAAPTRGDPMFHTWIEFGNRMVTVVVTVVAVAVLIAAWRFRPGGRRRRDLVWLAAAQPAGVVAQIVVGGIVVLTDLNPALVSLHFVVSVAVVAAAVALHVRCTEGTAPARSLVRPDLRLLACGVVAVTAVMLAAGTVVTGTGPLAGAGAVPRYHLPLTGVTQFHSDIGWLLGGLALPLVIGLRLTRAPTRVMRLGWLLLGLLGAQGVIGYTQYFTGLPAGLVWVHVSGSLLIWIAALRLMFAVRDRGPLITPPPASPGGPAASALPEAQPAPAR